MKNIKSINKIIYYRCTRYVSSIFLNIYLSIVAGMIISIITSSEIIFNYMSLLFAIVCFICIISIIKIQVKFEEKFDSIKIRSKKSYKELWSEVISFDQTNGGFTKRKKYLGLLYATFFSFTLSTTLLIKNTIEISETESEQKIEETFLLTTKIKELNNKLNDQESILLRLERKINVNNVLYDSLNIKFQDENKNDILIYDD